MEELVKQLLEDPQMAAVSAGLAAGATYAAATYALGRMQTYATKKEADEALETVYDSPLDVAKGLYDKGRKDSAMPIVEVHYEELPDPEEEIDTHFDETGSETDPSYGD